jgi:hypothetical protein
MAAAYPPRRACRVNIAGSTLSGQPWSQDAEVPIGGGNDRNKKT